MSRGTNTPYHEHATKWIGAAALALVLAQGLSYARAQDLTFSVNGLPGLKWWASAQNSTLFANPDQTGSVGNGDPVGFISDLSGQGHDAVMGNSVVPGGNSMRPQLVTGAVRGGPAI